jgi:hypothetical protein
MYKNILQGIENIEIWPVISFIIFFVFFIALLWWVITRDKEFIAKMKSMPIEDSDATEPHTDNVKKL